jgi:uncharacterized protein (TIGR04255 family)
MVGRILPDYENPPVVETALGVRFAPIAGWNVLHFGKLLQAYKEWYPKLELKPPIGVEIQLNPLAESFDFPLRLWLIDASDTQLIQVQHNFFIRNWRKTATATEYTHYEEVKPLFSRDWSVFCQFLDDQELPRPDVWQCEVTYINHVLRGKEWDTPRDFQRLFRIWKDTALDDPLESPETGSFMVSYALRGGSRLQFLGQPAIRRIDGTEVFQLTITATGKPEDSSPEKLLSWLDEGRAAVVNGFTAFTTEDAQEIWRRIL